WDWMNDPEIHSSTWEWDMSGASKHWRYTHNFVHHKYTNILGMDDDVGYGLLRVTRDQPWKRFNLFNLVYNTLLALGFEWASDCSMSRSASSSRRGWTTMKPGSGSTSFWPS